MKLQLKDAFIITLTLKIASAVAAWLFNAPWSLGFTVPLAFMIAYMVYGYRVTRKLARSDRLNYGDSCYYLGFLFTIASIILALFDIRSDGFDVGAIAVRFGAAMITTLLGMAMRVYLVTFSGREENRGFQIFKNNSFQLPKEGDGRDGGNAQKDGQASGKAPAGEGPGKNGGSKKGSAMDSMEPREISPDDGFKVVIETTLYNLQLLNRQLNENLRAFDQLRSQVLNTSARMTNEFKLQTERMGEFSDGLKARLDSAVDDKMGAFSEGMARTLEENAKAIEKLTEESSKAITSAAASGTEGIRQVADQAGAGIGELRERFDKALGAPINTDRLNSGVEALASRLEGAGEGVARSMQRYAGVFDAAATQTAAQLERSAGGLSKPVEALNRAVDSSGIERSLRGLSESVMTAGQNINAASERICQSAQAALPPEKDPVPEKLTQINESINLLRRDFSAQQGRARKGVFGRLFSKE